MTYQKYAAAGAIFTLSLCMTSLAAAACTPKHQVKTGTSGVLTVAVTTLPPASFMSTSGEMQGVDNDVLTHFAKLECLKVKPIQVAPAAAIQYTLSGQADVTTGSWYRTKERTKVLGLSTPLYLDEMAIYSKQGWSEVKQLEGKKVGTIQGYLWVSDMRKVLGNDLKLYPDASNALEDLRHERVQAVAGSYIAGVAAEQQGALKGFKIEIAKVDSRVRATAEPAQIGIPYTKSLTSLGAALDADITEMHKDGTISKILEKYNLNPKLGDTGTPRLLD